MTVDDGVKSSSPASTTGNTGSTGPTGQALPRPASSSARLQGIDAARGFALLGMILVHSLLMVNPGAFGSEIVYHLLSGNAASLFALLAGVSLALISGGTRPRRGRDLTRARVVIAVRALLVMAGGLLLNLVPLDAFSILPFYGVFFLVGALLIGLRRRWLVVLAAAFALGGPVVIHLVEATGVYPGSSSPSVVDVVTEPGSVALALLVTGYYPAVTWLAYIALGIALGRTDLRKISVQIALVIGGAAMSFVGTALSNHLLYGMDGYERILEMTPLPEDEIGEVLEYGGHVPADTWWWLAANGSHSNTPFSMMESIGWAMLGLGMFLLASRVMAPLLAPLAAAGTMTLTFYTAHLLVLTVMDVWSMGLLWSVLQMVAVLVIGYFWRLAIGQGPLEKVVAVTSKKVGRLVVRDTPR